MTRPLRTVLWMLLFLSVVAVASTAAPGALAVAFMANPMLNGLILGVQVVGILISFRQVLALQPEVAWIEAFRRREPAQEPLEAPRLLAPMARMLEGQQGDTLTLSAMSMRSMLDSIRSRLEESRELIRYTIGLLIFLGLLGTFWGLLTTIQAVADVIGGLSFDSADSLAVFDRMKAGLGQPLAGMGTAFSTSLFGLAGALVLGFLDLQAGHAQTRFFNELEEWLAGATRLSRAPAGDGDGTGTVPAYVSALLEQTADSLDRLQRSLSDSEEEHRHASDKLFALTEQLARLTDHMGAEMRVFQSIAESQAELKPVLERLGETPSGAFDEASRIHLRNLDVGVTRMAEEAAAGRERLLRELRNELRLLCRTIGAAGGSRDAPAAPAAPAH
jgi:hypothetical protein